MKKLAMPKGTTSPAYPFGNPMPAAVGKGKKGGSKTQQPKKTKAANNYRSHLMGAIKY